MDHILLCTNHIPPITTIYNSFIEDYMPAANGSYVKVYLYIAKCLQAKESNFSISSLADQLENTEKDILRALMYWEKKGLMSLNRDKATGEILGLEMLIPFAERDFDTYENTAKESAASLGVDSQKPVRSIDAILISQKPTQRIHQLMNHPEPTLLLMSIPMFTEQAIPRRRTIPLP